MSSHPFAAALNVLDAWLDHHEHGDLNDDEAAEVAEVEAAARALESLGKGTSPVLYVVLRPDADVDFYLDEVFTNAAAAQACANDLTRSGYAGRVIWFAPEDALDTYTPEVKA